MNNEDATLCPAVSSFEYVTHRNYILKSYDTK